jgi:predicted esterase
VPSNDPQPGASGNGGSFIPSFGDAMAARFQVPIGIIATGVGATSVREWLPQGGRFPNPPTLTHHVKATADGDWECDGAIFSSFAERLKQLGTNGFRAVLWHQGESDANQGDTTRTLRGDLYAKYLSRLIQSSRHAAGWDFPWFVAQVSYHKPDIASSSDIRSAQESVWKSGLALPGPDSDALTGLLRENHGQGIHLSGEGLREHGRRWAAKVGPWLEQQLASAQLPARSKPAASTPPGKLVLPGQNFTVNGRPAFVFMPVEAKRTTPQPWIFYAPTLSAYPDEAERWMHEQFLAAGVAVAGIDVGEAYGNLKSHASFEALHAELTTKHGFATKPCLFGRSRGGLWVSSWALAHPERVAGIIGIYPVFDFRTYPGVTNAAPSYGITPEELVSREMELNPIERIALLAKAKIPVVLIHGDIDKVVPIKENSAEFVRRYKEAGAESLVRLIILKDQGHNFFEGFFHARELVDFAIERAKAGAEVPGQLKRARFESPEQ